MTDSLKPMRRLRSTMSALLVGGLVLVATGCTAEPEETAQPAPAPSSTYESTYVAPDPTEVTPLRGTTVPAGTVDNPALSAKIDNHGAARPQVGLEKADIVFEELVEGGLTRYVAVWQSEVPELIGPVRSIRPMDPDIVSPFSGIIAYSGGQQMFVDMMQNTPVYNAIHGEAGTESTFYRADDREAPHNVIVKAKKLVDQHKKLSAPTTQFAFAADVPSSTAFKDGKATASITDVYSDARYPSWKYDGKSESWLRSHESGDDVDSNGDQLRATNVVSMLVDIDWRYDYIPKTVMVDSGKAYVSTGGKTVTATWSKDSATAPIRLVDEYGATVRLAAGNTWVQLVPTDTGSVEIEAPASE